jgi:hypothetical protein
MRVGALGLHRRVPGCRQVAPQTPLPLSLSWLQNGCAVLPAPDREWLNRGLSLPKSACPPGVLVGPRERRPHAGDDRRRPPIRPPTPPPCWMSTASCSGSSASLPPWTATRPCGYGRSVGRSAAGRSRVPTGSAGRWPSGWSATASTWWTCRPSWPPGCGCCRSAMAARATPTTRSRWRSRPATSPPCGRSASRTRQWCCTC